MLANLFVNKTTKQGDIYRIRIKAHPANESRKFNFDFVLKVS